MFGILGIKTVFPISKSLLLIKLSVSFRKTMLVNFETPNNINKIGSTQHWHTKSNGLLY